MDKKFLHKVVDQIVRETMVDYDKERLYTPFRLPSHFFGQIKKGMKQHLTKNQLRIRPFSNLYSFSPSLLFSQHCKEVYGLNIEEMYYVWEEYKHIIIDKINNGL